MAKSPKRRKGNSTVITENSIIFALSPEEQQKAKDCLAKTGKIKIKFKEISITKLPKILDNGRLID